MFGKFKLTFLLFYFVFTRTKVEEAFSVWKSSQLFSNKTNAGCKDLEFRGVVKDGAFIFSICYLKFDQVTVAEDISGINCLGQMLSHGKC